MLTSRFAARCSLLLCATISAPPLPSQATASPASVVAAVRGARALYYTPVDQGLQGFHCELSFDWKTFMEKASNQSVPDNDARLQYLRTIQLTVDDDLQGKGELHWTAPAPPPDQTEDSISRMRSGFGQIWSGFFESWNAFLTGNLVTLDRQTSLERTPAGYHVSVRNGSSLAEEQFDDKLILKQVHVATPALDSVVLPTFSATPQGLLVASLQSFVKQPPTAEPTEVLMSINYSPVSKFQIPSELIVTVGPAHFDWRLQNCTVRTSLTQK